MCVQECILHRIDPCRQRPRVTTNCLAGGLIYGFSFIHPYHVDAKKLSKILLQASVVGLGFGMDLQQVMQAGRSGFIYTAASISIALLLGWGLGRLLRVKQRISLSHLGRYRHLRRQRHCRDCPNHQCEPGRDCRLARNCFCAELDCLAHIPAIGTSLHMTQTQFGLGRRSPFMT
jgi:hypothetical protein